MADSVTLAYVHSSRVSYSWHRSVTDSVFYDLGRNQHLLAGGFLGTRYGTEGLVAARNQTVAMFLERGADWLWWIDTDMGFAPDGLYKLLEAADPVKRPIVGGLCFVWHETETDGMGGFRAEAVPTVYMWRHTEADAGFYPWLDYPRDEVVQCQATGCAFILVHRSVFAKIGANPYERLRNPVSGAMLGEDLSFCAKATQAGFPVHVHTGAQTTHHKELWVSERDFDAARPVPDRWVARPGAA